MNKVPISIIIDDPSPIVMVYWSHHKTRVLDDGRPVIEKTPLSTLDTFCSIVEEFGIKGKFSVVPMPGNRGDIVNGIDGVTNEELTAWLDMVKSRLMPAFAIGPEILTHHKAVDLATGAALELNEQQWAADKDRTVLTPYIAKGLELLKAVGIDSCGVTSPWAFGIECEEEYVAAISAAVSQVAGEDTAWYFLRGLRNTPNAKPWVALDEGGKTVVSIPATLVDHYWQGINTTDDSDEFVNKMADEIITEDGTAGELIRVLETGGWPILITHWQSLVSNGSLSGMRAFRETARRIQKNLGDRVEWKSFIEIKDIVAADKASYPMPVFKK